MSSPDVRWHDDVLSTSEALRAHVAELRGIAQEEVSAGHLCLHCGSSDHGRPWVHLATGEDLAVSASHADGRLLTAVTDHGWVGVDVEVIARVERAWDPELVLFHEDSSEEPTSPEQRAGIWAGKEAVLKAIGLGMVMPMPEVRLADWPVQELPAPEGLVARVVVIDPDELGTP